MLDNTAKRDDRSVERAPTGGSAAQSPNHVPSLAQSFELGPELRLPPRPQEAPDSVVADQAAAPACIEKKGDCTEKKGNFAEKAGADPVPLLQPSLFATAFRSSWSSFFEPLRRIPVLGRALESPLVAGTGVVAACTAGAAWLYAAPAQALGCLAAGWIVRSMGYTRNDHLRAQNTVGQSLFAAHIGMLGAWPSFIGCVVSATRNFLQGMIPEQRTMLRGAVATLGYAAGAAAYASCITVFPLVQLDNIPFLAMTLAAAAEAFPVRLSWATRLCLATGSSLMIPYHIFQSESLFGVATNVAALATLVSKICRQDLMRRGSAATPASASAQYASSGIGAEGQPGPRRAS